jgi:hypothetical protein
MSKSHGDLSGTRGSTVPIYATVQKRKNDQHKVNQAINQKSF